MVLSVVRFVLCGAAAAVIVSIVPVSRLATSFGARRTCLVDYGVRVSPGKEKKDNQLIEATPGGVITFARYWTWLFDLLAAGPVKWR